MSLGKDDVRNALAVQPPEALRAILIAAGMSDPGEGPSDALADQVVKQLWWSAQTPLGYAAGNAALEDIVQRVAKRLDVRHKVLPSEDGWTQLAHLTRALVANLPEGHGVALSDLDSGMRDRLRPHWKRSVALGGGAGSSLGARLASNAVLGFLAGPIGRLLPLIPPLAPWVHTIGAGARTIQMVTGPLGVALAVLSINQALGPDYKKLLPLLLGIGALAPNSSSPAQEVGV